MNYKYIFGFFSLIYLISQTRAWKWQNALALNEALKNFIENKGKHPLLGMDVKKMNEKEKMKICTDAAARIDSIILPPNVTRVSDSELKVRIPINWHTSDDKVLSCDIVFSCGGTEEKTYFFGQGPRENTIAVYVQLKGDKFGRPYGIMDFTLQLQQSQAHALKWYGSDALINALNNFTFNKDIFGFLGKDIKNVDEEKRMKICSDAATGKHIKMPEQTDRKTIKIVDFKINLQYYSGRIYESKTLYGGLCSTIEKKEYYLGKGPYENTYAMYAKHVGLSSAFELGIMDYSWQPQTLLWKWYDVLELNKALQSNLAFSGKDVTEMSNEEKINICTNAVTSAIIPQIVVKLTDIRNLAVAIRVAGIKKEETFPVFSCGKNKGTRYFFGAGPSENTITAYSRMENFDLGEALDMKNDDLGLPLGIMDTLTWRWRDLLEVNETLQNYHPFLGPDITKMSNVEKKEICTKGNTLAVLPQIVVELSDVTNLAVATIVEGFNKEQTFSVFSCGKSEGKIYLFGKGPRENTIAVYTRMENSNLGVPLGIMEYSSQPQQ